MTHDVAENMRLLKMIREDPPWALARIKTAAVKEREVARLEAENADLLRRLDRWEAGLRATEGLRALEQPDA